MTIDDNTSQETVDDDVPVSDVTEDQLAELLADPDEQDTEEDDGDEAEAEASEEDEDAEEDSDDDEAEEDDDRPRDAKGRFVAHDGRVKLPDGSTTTVEDLVQGSLRQSDYTQKTQSLAEERKKLEAQKQMKALDIQAQKAKEEAQAQGDIIKEQAQLQADQQMKVLDDQFNHFKAELDATVKREGYQKDIFIEQMRQGQRDKELSDKVSYGASEKMKSVLDDITNAVSEMARVNNAPRRITRDEQGNITGVELVVDEPKIRAVN